MNQVHFMIDIETLGTDPSHAPMIQLAAVPFRIEPKIELIPQFFKKSLGPLPGRFPSEETLTWWQQRPALLKDIRSKAEPAKEVMEAFFIYVTDIAKGGEIFLWAKPQSFDWNFVASYFEQTGVMNPFNFRNAIDMRSWLRAQLGTMSLNDVAEFENSIPFQGQEHDAIYDALHQVRIVLKALEVTKS